MDGGSSVSVVGSRSCFISVDGGSGLWVSRCMIAFHVSRMAHG